MRKDVMSCNEIRYWIVELRNTHGWPTKCLARTLAAYDTPTMLGKLKGKWFYKGEQVRFTRQLDRILSGELVPRKFGQRWEAVVADHPVPLKVPARMKFDLASGRLGYVQPRLRPPPTLPGFKAGIETLQRRFNGRDA